MRFLELLTALAGIVMSFGYYPQAYKIWQTKRSADISIPTFAMMVIGTSIWTIYGFAKMDWTIVSSFLFGAIGSWLTLILTLWYRRGSQTHPVAVPSVVSIPPSLPTSPAPVTSESALKQTANFLFEVGILAKTPRSGFYFLGSGQQSVAEHTHRAVYVGFTLSMLAGDVDTSRVMQMCLMHDLAEGRTSDLNYVHQKYAHADEQKAIEDIATSVPFGARIKEILYEYEQRASKESLLAKDADQIELLLSLREESDTGNTRATTWIPALVKRLKTTEGQTLAQAILATPSDEWWFSEKDKQDEWWVSRNGKK
jgi:putative hydrolase of HD superfamily